MNPRSAFFDGGLRFFGDDEDDVFTVKLRGSAGLVSSRLVERTAVEAGSGAASIEAAWTAGSLG